MGRISPRKSRVSAALLCMAESLGDSCLAGSSARTRFSTPPGPIFVGHSFVPSVGSSFELRPPLHTDLVRHHLPDRAGNSVSSERATTAVHFVRHVGESRSHVVASSPDLATGSCAVTGVGGKLRGTLCGTEVGQHHGGAAMLGALAFGPCRCP